VYAFVVRTIVSTALILFYYTQKREAEEEMDDDYDSENAKKVALAWS
tara:strand:+ start:523 stop:663 length:141 start_codon:yes stop_codon:yes gene_type:complete